MATFDLYSTVHKGLRSLLYDAATCVGRTDFTSEAEVGAAVRTVRRALDFLDEHAEHEDREILPVLQAKNAWTAEELGADHARLEGLHQEIVALLPRIEGAEGSLRESLGQRLAQRVNRLVAEHIHHMEREERSGNRVLWAHCTDEELQAIHQRIVTTIGAQRLVQWAEFMVPALDRREREHMLAGIRELVPAAVVAALGLGAMEVRG